MNPIQEGDLLMILNVLLRYRSSLVLKWSVQTPDTPSAVGGFPSSHRSIRWLHLWAGLARSFLVHVYMTTTGATPLEASARWSPVMKKWKRMNNFFVWLK